MTDRPRRTRAPRTAPRPAGACGRAPRHAEDVAPEIEFDGDVPEAWVRTTLGAIASVSGGLTKGKRRAPGERLRAVPYLRVANVQRGHIDLTEVKMIEATEAEIHDLRLQPGDVLFTEGGDRDKLGRGWVWAGEIKECIHQNHIFRARLLDPRVSSKYVSLFGNTFGKDYFMAEASQTVNLASINLSKLRGFPIALPPPEEQALIVAKVEEVLAHVNAARDHLALVAALLKRFRQSVLAAACSGALTDTWRRGRVPPDVDDTADEAPSGWSTLRLADLLEPGGLFDGPFGSNLKTSDYTAHGIRVVRLENLAHLRFIEGKRTFIAERKYESLRRHTVLEGDILFGSFVDDTVRVCLLPRLDTPAIAKADCFCLRPRRGLVDPRYLVLQLATSHTRDALVEQIHGATRPRITTSQLRELDISLCRLEEQREIVRRVDALFALADSIEQRVADATARADALTQATLAKAFRGELLLPQHRPSPPGAATR